MEKTTLEEYIQKNNITDVICISEGHYKTIGTSAYKNKNPMWEICENGKEVWLMFCSPNILCKLCPVSYQKILDYEEEFYEGKKITWFKGANGYILSSNKMLYIHQIITGYYGNGKGTKNISVNHIDRDPCNNRMDNLRISSREEQEQNSKGIMEGTKRARKTIAKPLPEGIIQDMLVKYVVYYDELVYPAKNRRREYFKIETHPKLAKAWVGTKSTRVSIQEKLAQVNLVVENLEKDIYPESV